MNYELVRSNRRTVCVEIRDGRVLVRAPYLMPRFRIERFVAEHEGWIQKKLARAAATKEKLAEGPGKMTEEERQALMKRAKPVFLSRVQHYAPIVGVQYGDISVRTQKTRWGSCTAKGNLSFNALLLLAPPEVLDSTVVHELCHRKEMNHSARFYAEVRRAFPDYDRCQRWLKQHGDELMGRI